jgi:hypothetical protein
MPPREAAAKPDPSVSPQHCVNLMVQMEELRLKVKAAVGSEPLRTVALGVRHPDGSMTFTPTSEPLPDELLESLSRYFGEFGLSVGTWSHRIGDTNYQVEFTNLSTTI